MFDFKIPIVGENITSGTVVKIMVKPGDKVKKEQALLELETDKASLEVPSPVDGVIKEILVKEGQTIKIGQVAMKIESGAQSPVPSPQSPVSSSQPKTKAQEPVQQPSAKIKDFCETSPNENSFGGRATSDPDAHLRSVGTPTEVNERRSEQRIHLAVIGGGPGGYAAAFLAADLGLDVTLIDKDVNPG